jgi:hypothetical protein
MPEIVLHGAKIDAGVAEVVSTQQLFRLMRALDEGKVYP